MEISERTQDQIRKQMLMGAFFTNYRAEELIKETKQGLSSLVMELDRQNAKLTELEILNEKDFDSFYELLKLAGLEAHHVISSQAFLGFCRALFPKEEIPKSEIIVTILHKVIKRMEDENL